MKAVDVISIFDKIRPNSFEFSTKRAWVNSVETDIRRFVSLHADSTADTGFLTEENPLLYLDETYTDLYVYYLVSMADMTNGEYRMYNISSTYFNSIFDKWKKIYRSQIKPGGIAAIKM